MENRHETGPDRLGRLVLGRDLPIAVNPGPLLALACLHGQRDGRTGRALSKKITFWCWVVGIDTALVGSRHLALAYCRAFV